MKIIKGDLLKEFPVNLDAIGHVCNCQGVMGSGIALAIRDKFPTVYTTYKNHERVHGNLNLGIISTSMVEPNKYVSIYMHKIGMDMTAFAISIMNLSI